jgi:hypothetical protein
LYSFCIIFLTSLTHALLFSVESRYAHATQNTDHGAPCVLYDSLMLYGVTNYLVYGLCICVRLDVWTMSWIICGVVILITYSLRSQIIVVVDFLNYV